MKVVPTGVPRIYLGTMTFGWSQSSSFIDENIAKKMTKKFIEFGKATSSNDNDAVHYIDTARIYSGGKSEKIVGSVLKDLSASDSASASASVMIGTKAHPSQRNALSKQGIMDQFNTSIQSMDVSTVGEYYLHQPDTAHSLLESLQTVHDLIEKGQVQTLGLSNYHVSEVVRAFDLCEEYGLHPPRVYQGLYNPLNRAVEEELLPLLKEKGCSFVAYNPLAAGLLTGKHERINEESDGATAGSATAVKKGRFKNNPNYLPRFYTTDNFDALELIQTACEKEGLGVLPTTFKWLLRHSALTESDGILLGASSIDQLDENLEACRLAVAVSKHTDDESESESPLSEDVLQAFEDAWKITKESPFPYWRSYSSDMPNREHLDQGASYSATKK